MDNDSNKELRNIVEIRDRRFRIAQSVFMAVSVLGLLAVFTIQTRTLLAVRQQLDAQRGTIAAIKNANEEQSQIQREEIGKVNKHLDCIVVFFQQTNRTNLTIEDINNCTLNNRAATAHSYQESLGINIAATP